MFHQLVLSVSRDDDSLWAECNNCSSKLPKMQIFVFSLLLLAWTNTVISAASESRSFIIDYENNQFLKDGKPFRYISGSMHYFRVDRMYWKDRFAKMVAAGLNAVETYVEWSQHEPYPGQYNFKDNLDLVAYIKLAQQMGLLVILRAGPYIDAERDMGGFPFWLLRENPKMVLRSKDASYLKFVDKWFSVLLPLMKPLLYANGGPIISVQVENEYGSHYTCDFTYTSHLRDLFRFYLGKNVILFTTDGSGDDYLKCGKIQNVYATVDFGPGANVTNAFRAQRNHQPKGPLVNSEYYPGWLDHWAYPHVNTSTDLVIQTLNEILAMNASVNFYMFHGGTSFGFTNGANLGSNYNACPTSYDYAAPISESGDITEKYNRIRAVISKYAPVPPGPIPGPVPKYAYGTLYMRPVGDFFEMLSIISNSQPIHSHNPLTFEQLGQAYGFVLYSKIITGVFMDPALLTISGIRDRGIVFINETPVGILSRQDNIVSLPIVIKSGQKLQILVENQGRVCYGKGINDFKGIIGPVTLSKKILKEWDNFPIPLNDSYWLDHVMRKMLISNQTLGKQINRGLNGGYGSGYYSGFFIVPKNLSSPQDTFLKMDGWSKGIAVVNGFNIGRYWPIVGPQITLYIPASKLKPYPERNTVVLVELENAPCAHYGQNQTVMCPVEMVDKPIINGPTPYQDSLSWQAKRFF